MPKKLYKDTPDSYPVCQHEDCPRANICLHQLAYRSLLERNHILQLLNPKQCTKNKKCPHFRNSTPTKYARGFIGMQKQMLPGQYNTFKSILIHQFSRNPYFERRRGETALSPKEQNIVLRALRQAGVTAKLDFDSYEDNINWYD